MTEALHFGEFRLNAFEDIVSIDALAALKRREPFADLVGPAGAEVDLSAWWDLATLGVAGAMGSGDMGGMNMN